MKLSFTKSINNGGDVGSDERTVNMFLRHLA